MVAPPGDGTVPHRYERGVRGHSRANLERESTRRQQRRASGEAADRELAAQRVHDRVRCLVRRGTGRSGRTGVIVTITSAGHA